MKLRNFLYLNTKIVEDYISAIDGFTYDEESQAIMSEHQKNLDGKIGGKNLSIGGICGGGQSEEIRRSVKISNAAKFEKIYNFLKSGDEDEQLKYYEFLSDDIFENLNRDDFIEVLVTARFSKAKELTDSVKKFANLAALIQNFTDEDILDKKAKEAIDGFAAIGNLKSGKEISCVFNFDDNKFPIVAYLDESYFKCEQENFVGQSYMLCKVLRKIPKGQSIKLDEIFEDVKKLPLNREQRRNMSKDMENPDIMKDVIKGPALTVIPVAVYQ